MGFERWRRAPSDAYRSSFSGFNPNRRQSFGTKPEGLDRARRFYATYPQLCRLQAYGGGTEELQGDRLASSREFAGYGSTAACRWAPRAGGLSTSPFGGLNAIVCLNVIGLGHEAGFPLGPGLKTRRAFHLFRSLKPWGYR